MANRELEISHPWYGFEFYQDVAQIEGVEITEWSNGATNFWMSNVQRPPTDDIHFRKALNWMLDWDQLLNEIYPGWEQAAGPIAQGFAGYRAGLFQYYQDLDKAREELQKSKYADRLDEVTVHVGRDTTVPPRLKTALLLQATAAEFGINVEIEDMPWGKIQEAAGSMEAAPNLLQVIIFPHYLDAGSMLAAKYHSSNVGTWEQSEWILSDVLDALIDDALVTLDQQERYRKYGLIQEIIVEFAPGIILMDMLERHAVQTAYVNWPMVVPSNFVMGYSLDCRFLEVFPDRIPRG